jgi:tetratricopeptide (TPR) repeat protein
MLALVVVVSAIALAVQREAGGGALAPSADLGLGSRVANGVDTIVGSLRRIFWPSGLAVYDPHLGDTSSTARVLSGAALLVVVSAAVLRVWRTRPAWGVGWLWFLGVLVPMLGILQLGSQARADRALYIPLVGLSVALAWGVLEAVRRRDLSRRIVAGAAAVAVVALAAVSFVQVGTWRSSETLFARVLAVAPDSFFGHKGLGLVRLKQERWQEAEQHLERSWQLRPDLGGPALARFYRLEARRALQADDWEEFQRRLEQVLEVVPDDAGTRGQLGAVYAREGRLSDARAMLEQALAEPGAPPTTYVSMARLEWSAGNRAESAEWSWAVLERDRYNAWAVHNLAWILATSRDPELRDPEEAVALAESLVSPDDAPDANLLDTLAAAYAAAGRSEEAVAAAERGIARAEASGDAALAATLLERRELYRSGGALAEP